MDSGKQWALVGILVFLSVRLELQAQTEGDTGYNYEAAYDDVYDDDSAQTEGDTGYNYDDAYIDEYDDDSVLGMEPTFDVPLVNVTVVAKQVAVLPCSIDYLGKYKVAWLDQNSIPLTYEDRRVIDDSRFSIVRPYIKEWNLQIRDVQWSDQGQYRCTINTKPIKSKVVTLHVKVAPKILDELSSDDITVQEGDTVVLVCNVTGVPKPDVTWFRRPANSKSERESKRCKPRAMGQGPVVTIPTGMGLVGEMILIQNVSRYCDDIYECVADNNVPPVESRMMRVTVEWIGLTGEIIIIQNVSRYCDDIYDCVADNGVRPMQSRSMRVTVEFAPEITMPNKRIGQLRGKDTILECIITAYPQANNYWAKGGKKVSTSAKYRIEAYDEGDNTLTLSLRIHDIDASDYGEFECRANNALGQDSETMYLYEYVKPAEENGNRPTPQTPWPEWLPSPDNDNTKPDGKPEVKYPYNYNEYEKNSGETPLTGSRISGCLSNNMSLLSLLCLTALLAVTVTYMTSVRVLV